VTVRPGPAPRRERRGLIGPFSGRQLLSGVVVVLVSAVILVVVTTPLGSGQVAGLNDPQATPFMIDPSAQIGVRPGERAPDLAVVRPDGSTFQLMDLEGRPIRLADLRGRAVWLNFWASWCPPCQAETPTIRDLAERYANRGLVVVGISVQEASADNVAAYANRYQLTYTIAADVTGEIFRLYRPPGLPTSIFIGPDGIVRSFKIGPLRDTEAAAMIEPLLPTPQPSLPAPGPS